MKLRKYPFNILLLAILVVSSGAFAEDSQEYTLKDLNEQMVMGSAWYHSSAEMRAICYQTFTLAKLLFDLDLQQGESKKPRAVVVDIDETVLDNFPYEKEDDRKRFCVQPANLQ